MGQKGLEQRGRETGAQLGFNYAQLGQQGRQFGAELELGYAGLNARRSQPSQPAPAPTINAGRSIWDPLLGSTGVGSSGGNGGGSGGSSNTGVGYDWNFDPAAANAKLGNVATGF